MLKEYIKDKLEYLLSIFVFVILPLYVLFFTVFGHVVLHLFLHFLFHPLGFAVSLFFIWAIWKSYFSDTEDYEY